MWIRRILILIGFVFGVLLIAALPRLLEMLLFSSSSSTMPKEYNVLIFGTLDPSTLKVSTPEAFRSIFDDIFGYVKGILTGESFTYKHFLYFNQNEEVSETRNFFIETRPLIVYSAVNMVFASVLALLLGTLIGLLLARSRGWIKNALEFLVIIPDFATAFFLQLLVVFLYTRTDILIAEVATTSIDTAYLLPFLTLFCLPFVYIVRMVSSHTYKVLSEDYILTAKSKGLKKRTIYAQHILRNILPLIKADLFRIASIMTGNMIIIEYLFNSPGITRFLAPGLDRNLGYVPDLFHQKPNLFDQYPIMVNSLWSLILIFFLTYGAMRLTITGLERRFAHD
ncbi:ABC transporter permease subunit [Paenactinomyces guangxiensis]|uniref:ABC transporter permease subunit n=1 Tax=Paenactinomyces guangxiensis TaxID=1490290 RepID=A0A7W1WUS7_9BACL|nr:ABC transporter permease subunit [Paenactinomyces guangxiensis]MBA4496470.1 ABC transporter permease subunit [Paenactinomyces guangxiensis]MBH8593586.1 ABC transporter permease subunit [Paenactinomyces guangxiensis]